MRREINKLMIQARKDEDPPRAMFGLEKQLDLVQRNQVPCVNIIIIMIECKDL